MERVVLPTSTYIYGAREIENLAEHVKIYGTKSFILIDSLLIETIGKKISNSYTCTESIYKITDVSEKSSTEDMNRLIKEAESYDNIIGIGSGKTLDMANEIAYMNGCSFIVIPFITFTNASCSGCLNVSWEDYAMYSRKPNMVIIDNQAIVDAPISFLVKGIEHTLSVYFDLRAAIRYSSKLSRKAELMSFELMRLNKCYEHILENGLQAIRDAQENVLTRKLESVVQSCLYINYAFYSQEGLNIHSKYAVIHSVRNGLSMLKAKSSQSNKEEISFAILVLLVLENVSTKELFQILSFLSEIGLPITLEEIGIHAIDSERMKQIAKIICAQKMMFGNTYVKPAEIAAAIITADSLGIQYLLERNVNISNF